MKKISEMEPEERKHYINALDTCKSLIGMMISESEAIKITISSYKLLDSKLLEDYLYENITSPTNYTVENPTVINEDSCNSEWWKLSKEELINEHGYWKRYKDYLRIYKGDDWSDDDVKNKIDIPTDALMNYLLNPNDNIIGERRGLVFGHVQSGKTAHYMGLINKAVDAGYNVIIVLAGIHNNLRKQTQIRIDKEVIGIDSNKNYNKSVIGVGEINPNLEPYLTSLTTCDDSGDFRGDYNPKPPVIIVSKKNSSRLVKLIDYITKYYCNGSKPAPNKYKLLLIDDEADQASLNTKKRNDKNKKKSDGKSNDTDPTTINKNIREILRLFNFKSYIGYTATPFANLFVHKYLDENYGWDLFPNDFITTIPESDNYIGAKKFFGLKDEDGIDEEDVEPAMPLCQFVKKPIKDTNTKKIIEYPGLKNALINYLIAVACRKCRFRNNKPNSMLIHIDRYTDSHLEFENYVTDLWRSICNGISVNDTETLSEIHDEWDKANDITSEMREKFPKHMKDIPDVKWDELLLEIKRLTKIEYNSDFKTELIRILVINGKSKDELDYETKAKKNEEYNVIVIGGDKLSRGLTLDGLSVSYFIRTAKSYDTLMQMGRWFGYRQGYLDLCRLYATESLIRDFRIVTLATYNLISQFKYLQNHKKRPFDIVLRVASDDRLLISSKGKIQTGELIRGTYNNSANQTRIIDINPEHNNSNYATVEKLLESCGKPINASDYFKSKGIPNKKSNHYFWEGNYINEVLSFFDKYHTASEATIVKSEAISQYISNTHNKNPEYLSNWTICLYNGSDENETCDIAGLCGVKCRKLSKLTNENLINLILSSSIFDLGALLSGNDEYLDFTLDETKRVNSMKTEKESESDDIYERKKSIIRREVRNKSNALLILYPLASNNIKEIDESLSNIKTPFGFAVIFPETQDKKSSFLDYRHTEQQGMKIIDNKNE